MYSESNHYQKIDPLWDLDNVMITPHIASMTNRYNGRCIDLFEENIKLFLEGMPMKYQILNQMVI